MREVGYSAGGEEVRENRPCQCETSASLFEQSVVQTMAAVIS